MFDCYSIGSVDGGPQVGGLVGGGGDIANCYSASTVTGSEYTGPLVGTYGTSTVINSFWDTEVTGINTADYGQGKTTAEMHDMNMYRDAGWSFVSGSGQSAHWQETSGWYPALSWQELVDVPQLTNRELPQAKNAILSGSLNIGDVVLEMNNTVSAGHIISQFPAGGARVPAGQAVDLVSSLGGGYYETGSGTGEDPWQISCSEDLIILGRTIDDYDNHFILTSDIDMGAYTFVQAVIAKDKNKYTPYVGTVFSGMFDGNGCTISNLTIDVTSDTIDNTNSNHSLGLFGKIDYPGEIRNLGVINAEITGLDSYHVGILAGCNGGEWNDDQGGTISNCYAKGVIHGVERNGGGLIGNNYKGIVTNCHTHVMIYGEESVGGLIGHNHRSSINNCNSAGEIYGNDSIGGLVGYNYNDEGNISKCSSSCAVTGSGENIGGFVGYNHGNISACYSIGVTQGTESGNKVAGLVGYNRQGSINQCYSSGPVSGNWLVRGLVAHNSFGTVEGSFWDIESSGQDISDGGFGKTTVEMMDMSTFTDSGWDFSEDDGDEADWVMIDDWYPVLARQELTAVPDITNLRLAATKTAIEGAGYSVGKITYHQSVDVSAGHVISQSPSGGTSVPEGTPISLIVSLGSGYETEGTGTTEDPWQISKAEDLIILSRTPADFDGHFILMNEIDMIDYPFTKAIIAPDTDDLTDNYQGTAFTGIFDGNGYSISNLSINAANTGSDYLGLFGQIGEGGVVKNLGLENAVIRGSNESSFAGSMTGDNLSGLVIDCFASVDVNAGGNNIAGLAGRNPGSILRCYSTGKVINGNDDSKFTGGITGHNMHGTVENCYSDVSVTCYGDVAGGLIGANGGDVTHCYSSGQVKCSNTVGGLIGSSYGGAITGCFWDKYTSGQLASSAGTGLTVIQMKDRSEFVNAGWDFEGVWWINDGRDYPRLFWQPFGDLNNDSRINTADLAILSASWLATDTDPDFNSVCELSGDNVIDTADLLALIDMWLQGRQFED